MRRSQKREKALRIMLSIVLLVATIGNYCVGSTASADVGRYEGTYEISELLSKFQYVSKGDVNLGSAGHTIGSVAVGGTFNVLNTFGDAAIVPSYIHKIGSTQGLGTGNPLADTGYTKNSTLYYGSGAENLPWWYTFYPSFQIIQNDAYMDLDSAFVTIAEESKNAAKNSEVLTPVDGVIKVDCLYVTSANVTIDYADLANGAKINILVPSMEWFAKNLLLINIVNVNDNNVVLSGYGDNTLVLINGEKSQNHFKYMDNSIDGGQVNLGGFNLVWNFPDAENVTSETIGGHIIAPLANVEVHNNYEGGIIAASISGDAEGHFYPLTADIMASYAPTATPTPTATATPEPTATATPEPTATDTPTPTATDTPTPTATNTPAPTATNTVTPTATPEPTATNTPVPTATDTPTPTATNTPAPTATNTATPTATTAPTATNTATPTATNTVTPTATPVPAKGAITINNYRIAEDDSEVRFPAVTYNLYDDISCNGTPIRSKDTDENGSLTFEDLEPGDYYITETTPDGYIENTSIYHAVINRDEANQVTITLYQDKTLITTDTIKVVNLTPTATNTATPTATDTPTPTATTVPTATNTATPTATTAPTATDTPTPTATTAPTATNTATPTATNTATPTATNTVTPTATPVPAKGAITINNYRIAEDDSEVRFPAVTYKLYDDISCNGTPICSKNTDENGSLTFEDLEPGDYYITETTPDGYIENTSIYHAVINRDEANQVTITLYQDKTLITTDTIKVVNLTPTATNTATPTATDTPTPTATTAPTATNTVTPTATPEPTATNTPVPTATNTVTPTATTAPTATNTATPTATTAPTATNTATPTATTAPTATNTATPTATNTVTPTATPVPAKGAITINNYRIAEDDSEVRFPSVTYKLYDDISCDGTPIRTKDTDENGSLTFEDLEPGDYYITETTPDGYIENTSIYHAVINRDEANQVTISLYENDVVITTDTIKVVNITPTATNTVTPTATTAPTATVTPASGFTNGNDSEATATPTEIPANDPTVENDPANDPDATAAPTETPASDPSTENDADNDSNPTPAPENSESDAPAAPDKDSDSTSVNTPTPTPFIELSTSSDTELQNSGITPNDSDSTNAKNPTTGDSSATAVWMGIMFLTLSTTTALVLLRKKREEERQ